VTTPALTRRFTFLPQDRSIGWVPYAWLIYLSSFYVDPVLNGASAWEWSATLAATVVFIAAYLRSYWVVGRQLVAIVLFEVALGVIFTPSNLGASVFFVYAASAAAFLDRPRAGPLGVALVTLAGMLTATAYDAPTFYWVSVVLIAPLIGAVNCHYAERLRADAKLRLAHAEIERLATVAERERIARDLHDVLGHTLTLIVLKAELASKLAERDPVRAVQEIREVESISRTALSEVRAAISGYRATWLDEVGRARTMLEVAGIRSEFTGAPDASMGRATEEAIALGLREAVTNVVRHAGATRCEVRWENAGDKARLVVADDGRGAGDEEGNGLRGLRERAEALGGTVDREPWRNAGGTQLTITVPVGRA